MLKPSEILTAPWYLLPLFKHAAFCSKILKSKSIIYIISVFPTHPYAEHNELNYS